MFRKFRDLCGPTAEESSLKKQNENYCLENISDFNKAMGRSVNKQPQRLIPEYRRNGG